MCFVSYKECMMIWFVNELNNLNSVSNESRLLATCGISSYAIAGLNFNSNKKLTKNIF